VADKPSEQAGELVARFRGVQARAMLVRLTNARLRAEAANFGHHLAAGRPSSPTPHDERQRPVASPTGQIYHAGPSSRVCSNSSLARTSAPDNAVVEQQREGGCGRPDLRRAGPTPAVAASSPRRGATELFRRATDAAR
jgi:hypothetical protein